MKSLRAKLFWSMGAIFLLVAILNNVIAAVWIRKELVRGGGSINKYIEEIQDHIRQFSSFLLTVGILEEAVELDRAANVVSKEQFLTSEEKSVREDIKRIIALHPRLAFIQVCDDEGNTRQVVPQDVRLSSFSWARGKNKNLWVKPVDSGELFAAVPTAVNRETVYLLFKKEDLQKAYENPLDASFASELLSSMGNEIELKDKSFTEITVPVDRYNWQDPVSSLFEEFLLHEQLWTKKTELIEVLLTWKEKGVLIPSGALMMEDNFLQGSCLLAQDLFPDLPVIKDMDAKEGLDVPFLLLRKDKKDLDMVKVFSFSLGRERSMAFGFSLSSLLQEAAGLVSKTIVAVGSDLAIGWKPNGEIFDPEESRFPLSQMVKGDKIVSWGKTSYFPYCIDLQVFQLYILNSETEAMAVMGFLEQLGEEIAFKVSLTLIVAAVISFIIALACLEKISGKITKPIAALSEAAKELGAGKYEGIVLPRLGKRQDEVATLTHSFEGMVNALRDRDKIRGVLNKSVSKEISEALLSQGIELQGQEKVVTLLFSDIRKFTRFAEGILPHILIEILNAYMTRMCRIIDDTHGVVDKFVGDEIMTLYGAPLSLEKHAQKAIKAAIRMIGDLSVWNEERRSRQEPIFEVGIGIHTGLVYTGNMGAENRLNYTAIGANVNKASRICSVAKAMQILISEETANEDGVQGIFRLQKLDPVQLRGIEEPVTLYEVLGENESERSV